MLGAVKGGSAAGSWAAESRRQLLSVPCFPGLECVPIGVDGIRSMVFHPQDIALAGLFLHHSFSLLYSTATTGDGKIFISFPQDSNPHQVTPGVPQRGRGRAQCDVAV